MLCITKKAPPFAQHVQKNLIFSTDSWYSPDITELKISDSHALRNSG